MANHLVIQEQLNDDSIIKVMTTEAIKKHGRTGMIIIQGNLLAAFEQILPIHKLIKRKDKI